MKISKNKVVTIDYQLHDEHGTLLDSSKENGELSYIQGLGLIIPGLERALEGHQAGDKIQVQVKPEDGYGDRDDNLIITANRDEFEDGPQLKVGLQIEADIDGETHLFTIIDIKGDQIKLDGNHPLAGENLNFDVEIKNVREASAEEIGHGHVH